MTGSFCLSAKGISWRQIFTGGYTEQAFRRVCVRASMIHGDANARYVQRKDKKLKTSATINRLAVA
eukprot:6208761-Pleurochrysis_carterae.AAC.1